MPIFEIHLPNSNPENAAREELATALEELRRQKEALLAARRACAELEQRVQTRTAELAQANAALRVEGAERRRAEAERASLAAELRAANDQLRAVSRRLVEVQEAERRDLAHELHDHVGQMLTGLQLTLETCMHLSTTALQSRLSQAETLIGDLMKQIRERSLDLRPALLDDLGLLPTLQWHFERYTSQTKIRVHFTHAGLDRRFAPEVETTAYRLVQEALTNTARHAGVIDVAVQLCADAGQLEVQIEDQGCGFEPEKTLRAGRTSGLAGMLERAALLGGRLIIESTPGAGARLCAELPLR